MKHRPQKLVPIYCQRAAQPSISPPYLGITKWGANFGGEKKIFAPGFGDIHLRASSQALTGWMGKAIWISPQMFYRLWISGEKKQKKPTQFSLNDSGPLGHLHPLNLPVKLHAATINIQCVTIS